MKLLQIISLNDFIIGKCKDRNSCLEYIKIKGKSSKLNCLKFNKSHEKYFIKALVKRFVNTYKFCDGVYPYENMSRWQRFNETSLSSKKIFYINLNKVDVTDINFKLRKDFRKILI